MNTRIQSCYISAPAGANLGVLTDVLRERGVAVAVPASAVPGSDWDVELNSIYARVELVIGVIPNSRRSQWVLFELGQARAMGKQILLFAPPKSELVPSDLYRFLVVRASVRNREAVTFAIDQLIAAPPAPQPRERTASGHDRPGLGGRADDFLTELLTTRGGEGLESLTSKILQASGVDVIAERPGADYGADLAVWADGLQSILGNPLLVEVKTKISSVAEGRTAMQRLASAVASSGTSWGLLIYADSPLDAGKLWSVAPPNIFVVSASALLEQLRERSFARVVTDLRNRRMHGGIP